MKIKYSDFTQAARSKTTSASLSGIEEIMEIAEALLRSVYRPVVLMGVTLSSLNTEIGGEQPQLNLGL